MHGFCHCIEKGSVKNYFRKTKNPEQNIDFLDKNSTELSTWVLKSSFFTSLFILFLKIFTFFHAGAASKLFIQQISHSMTGRKSMLYFWRQGSSLNIQRNYQVLSALKPRLTMKFDSLIRVRDFLVITVVHFWNSRLNNWIISNKVCFSIDYPKQ